MRVLLINNFHYLRGGSEKAYFDTARLLEKNGHQVAFFSTIHPANRQTKWSRYFIKSYDFQKLSQQGISRKIQAVFQVWYNWQARKKLRELIREFRPNVVHMHNIFHHLSPSIIDEIARWNIPMVMTLHDYNAASPSNLLYCDGKIWERGKNGKYYQCLIDRAVGKSYLKSFVCTVESYFHAAKGTLKKVHCFIAPSKFLKEKYQEFGFNQPITWLRNPLFLEEYQIKKKQRQEANEKYILFFGRISQEKGADDLIKAYNQINSKEFI